jgi:hypothetical protein
MIYKRQLNSDLLVQPAYGADQGEVTRRHSLPRDRLRARACHHDRPVLVLSRVATLAEQGSFIELPSSFDLARVPYSEQ